jgi:hypothetical protein
MNTDTLMRFCRALAVQHQFQYASGMSGGSLIGGFKHGAELRPLIVNRGDGDPIVGTKRSFLPYVTFEETAIGAGPASLESQHALEVCTETVKNIVIVGAKTSTATKSETVLGREGLNTTPASTQREDFGGQEPVWAYSTHTY